MSTDTLEREQVAAEVADLLAMLDGEPECEVASVTHVKRYGPVLVETTEPEWCQHPAAWVGRKDCGHPVCVCEHHHTVMIQMAGIRGVVGCQCGAEVPMATITWLPL